MISTLFLIVYNIIHLLHKKFEYSKIYKLNIIVIIIIVM